MMMDDDDYFSSSSSSSDTSTYSSSSSLSSADDSMASYHNSPAYPPKTLSSTSTSYYPPNSPTSTMLPPLPSFVGSYHHAQQYHQSDRARRSASTRPALNEMRKIMKDFKYSMDIRNTTIKYLRRYKKIHLRFSRTLLVFARYFSKT